MEYNKDVLNGKTRADLLMKLVSVISPQDQVSDYLKGVAHPKFLR